MEPILIISTVLLWLVVLFNMLLTFGIIRRVNVRSGATKPEMLRVGDLAPEFSAKTLDGQSINSNQIAGLELALVFMASTCTPCKDKVPELKGLFSAMEEKGGTLGLVFREPVDEVRRFVDEQQLAMPTFVTLPPNPCWTDYKVPGTPFCCLINASRRIQFAGFLDNGWIDNLLL